MLDKRLQLGGLQVGGPRTMQNVARFRVADNVYQTRDDVMVPRFGNKDFITGIPTSEKIITLTPYKLGVFAITMDASGVLRFYYESSTPLPTSDTVPTTPPPSLDDLVSFGIQCYENLGCLFINWPVVGLLKFDGVQVYRAGVPTPYISCAEYDAAGTTFVRVIGHTIDFEGNQVSSGYVEFPATPSGGNVTIQTDDSATDIITSPLGPLTGVSPVGRQVFDQYSLGFNNWYVVASAVAGSTATTFTLTTGGNHKVTPGAYIIFSLSYNSSTLNHFGVETYGFAFKVLSSTGTTVTFSLEDGKYLDFSRQWVTADATYQALGPSLLRACNQFLSVWTATSSTGNYVFQALLIAPWYATASYSTTVNVSTPTVPASTYVYQGLNISGNLGDIYDVTTQKFPFPALSDEFPSLSFCIYDDLAVISQVDVAYFSDSSLGGSFEMTNGLAFFVAGRGSDGPIQAVQGNSDFMLISHQFRNYYLSGNLPTANYRVTPIRQTSLGAYSNESTVSCADKIIFFNKAGVWALSSGGACDELSFNIKGLFENFSGTTDWTEEGYFDLSDYPTYIVPNALSEDPSNGYNKWLRVRFDVSRNLVFFLAAGSDSTGTCLVLNMNNGEFYTWNNILYNLTGADLKDICFIEGNYYITANCTASVRVRKEEKSDATYKYEFMAGAKPPTLKTTWFTAGEPSLEKKINQIKVWGLIEGDVVISHCIDWKSTSVSDGTYSNSEVGQFSHKKQLVPANALSVSVSMVLDTDVFEIEGIELEFQPFQQGMKR